MTFDEPVCAVHLTFGEEEASSHAIGIGEVQFFDQPEQ
jgi:hypothetical protein